jgi:hypothetical protein
MLSGTCPVCGRRQPLDDRTGKMTKHVNLQREPCAGKGRAPLEKKERRYRG